LELFLQPCTGLKPMRISVRVVPNAKRFSLKMEESGLKVYVEEKAEGNKANAALEKKLGRLLGREVRIASGAKSRRKVLEVAGEEGEALRAIGRACESRMRNEVKTESAERNGSKNKN
jgi:uncharacterized protein YggU (UPF0235/DUF167 family)